MVRARKEWNTAALVEALRRAAPERLDPDLLEASALLDAPADVVARDLLGEGAARIALDPARPLEILKRARHVLSETGRVLEAVRALEEGRLDEMGALMNQSHRSLAEDFDCSTARLDRMVECARGAGALGARLTGAGFGGSIVALCRPADASRIIAALVRGYYVPSGLEWQDACAVFRASPGASVIELALD